MTKTTLKQFFPISGFFSSVSCTLPPRIHLVACGIYRVLAKSTSQYAVPPGASVSMFYKVAVMGPASALRDPVRAQIKSIHIQIDLAGVHRWRAPTRRALRCWASTSGNNGNCLEWIWSRGGRWSGSVLWHASSGLGASRTPRMACGALLQPRSGVCAL